MDKDIQPAHRDLGSPMTAWQCPYPWHTAAARLPNKQTNKKKNKHFSLLILLKRRRCKMFISHTSTVVLIIAHIWCSHSKVDAHVDSPVSSFNRLGPE